MRIFSKKEKEEFISVCKSSKSMREAATKMGLPFSSFKRYALRFNCYKSNQAGVGVIKKSSRGYITKDILSGKHPKYQTYKLKKRLIDEGYIDDKCSKCGWNKKRHESDIYTNCELHHIDGNRHNHRLDNLEILCPNCHSLTQSFRARNKGNY